jgi:hypothetical protein
VVDEDDPDLKEDNEEEKEVKVLSPAELEKKRIMELVFLKEDG